MLLGRVKNKFHIYSIADLLNKQRTSLFFKLKDFLINIIGGDIKLMRKTVPAHKLFASSVDKSLICPDIIKT